jgi:hydrogenase-4 component F
MHHQYNSNKMQNIKNALKMQPLASWGIIIGSAAIIGMPPFPIFFSKLFILTQIGRVSLPGLALILILLFIIAAAFAFHLVHAFSQQTEARIEPYIVHQNMKIPIVVLLVLITAISFSLSFGLSNILTNITVSLGF